MLSSRFASSSNTSVSSFTANFCSAFLLSSIRFASSSQKPSLYSRLGVPTSASTDEIKKVFKKKALECHPDIIQSSTTMTRSEKAKAEAEFRSIAEAYETLSNDQKRKKYDQQHGLGVTAAAARGVSTQQQQEGKSDQKKSTAAKRTPSMKRPSYYSGPATSSSTTKKSSPSSGKGKSSPFLSKDAQRVFKEAFEGKSVHDVLFANAYSSKYGGSAKDVKKETHEQKEKQTQDPFPGGEQIKGTEMWQKFMQGSKEELAKQFKEKFPHADPKNYAFGLRKSFHLSPDEPPSNKFPFRPCPNLRLPETVHPGDEVQPIEAQQINFDADQVDRVSLSPARGFKDGHNERGEFEKLDDPDEYGRTLKNYRLPTNEGMVWSMRRKW